MRITEVRIEVDTSSGPIQGAVMLKDGEVSGVFAMRVPPTIGFRHAKILLDEAWQKDGFDART